MEYAGIYIAIASQDERVRGLDLDELQMLETHSATCRQAGHLDGENSGV